MRLMNPLNDVFRFVPYWYTNLNEINKDGEKVRSLLELNINQSKIFTGYLDCYTLNELVVFHWHNWKIKEFGLFDEKDVINISG